MVKVLNNNKAIEYNKQRHHAAISKTARANKMPSGDAENFAKNIIEKIEKWIHDKEEITAAELRAVTAGMMAEFDEDTGYLYGSENRVF